MFYFQFSFWNCISALLTDVTFNITGAAIFFEKEECVNRVTKRMGTNLRKLVKDIKRKNWKMVRGQVEKVDYSNS